MWQFLKKKYRKIKTIKRWAFMLGLHIWTLTAWEAAAAGVHVRRRVVEVVQPSKYVERITSVWITSDRPPPSGPPACWIWPLVCVLKSSIFLVQMSQFSIITWMLDLEHLFLDFVAATRRRLGSAFCLSKSGSFRCFCMTCNVRGLQSCCRAGGSILRVTDYAANYQML